MKQPKRLVARPEPYYRRNGIEIYHGECRQILPWLDLARVELCLTDPPYGVNTDTNYASKARGGQDFPRVHGDRQRFEPGFLLQFPHVILFGANNYADSLPLSQAWLVWDKRRGTGNDDGAEFELMYSTIGGGASARIFRHLWRGAVRDSERGLKRVHPTQKPVALMRWCLDQARLRGALSTDPPGLVIDPYMGSGSVLLAAREMGHPAIGIEISKRYCSAAARRLEELEEQLSAAPAAAEKGAATAPTEPPQG